MMLLVLRSSSGEAERRGEEKKNGTEEILNSSREEKIHLRDLARCNFEMVNYFKIQHVRV